MKKFYFLLLFCFAVLGNAQNVNIPDANFKAYLLPYVDVNHDNEVQLTETQNLGSINISSNYNISDLTGIESFTNLISFSIKYNPVSAPVDLSQNTQIKYLTVLGTYSSLNITGLLGLIYVQLSGNFTTLDISNRVSLTNLYLGVPNLNSINLANLPQLQALWINDANLTSIDVTQMPLLQELSLQQLDLTSINVTQNPNLNFLNVNGSPIGTINISQNPLLERLYLDNTNITSVNLQTAPLITDLSIGHNNLSSTGVDLSLIPLLKNLGVFQCQLSTLDLSNNPLIEDLSIGNNLLTAVNVSHLSLMYRFSCVGNKFTNMNLSGSPLLKYVSFTSNPFLTHINLKNGGNANLIWQGSSNYGFLPMLQEVCVDNPASSYAYQVNAAVPPAVNVTSQCTALDTNEIAIAQTDIKIYPNPVMDDVHISTKEKLFSYQIITSIGNLIDEGNFTSNDYKINMRNFPSGVYYIKLSNEKFVTVQKVIKK